MMEMANMAHLEAYDWKRSILIDTLDVKTTDFEKAKQKAIEGYRKDIDYFIFSDELEKSLEAITDAINCKYKLKSYDEVTVHITLNSEENDEVLDLKGVRAYKFIYNNYRNWRTIWRTKILNQDLYQCLEELM